MLEAIRAGAPISRAEISRRAGISKPTVSLALQSLLDAGARPRGDHDAGRADATGRSSSSPCRRPRSCSASTSAARFLRGAICDLRGDDPGAPGRRAATARTCRRALRRDRRACATRWSTASGLDASLVDGVVVGVPGVVDGRDAGTVAGHASRASRARDFGAELVGAARPARSRSRTTSTSRRSASSWHGVARGVDDFVFLSIGTGLGAGSCCTASCTAAATARPARSTSCSAALGDDVDPCAGAVPTLAERLARPGAERDAAPPYDPRTSSRAARARRRARRAAVVAEEARRIALHIVPIAAVADVALVVLGGGVGANGDLLLEPVRELLARWLPYPPRVEVSSLGEAAVLTGALAVGLRAALDNVFVNRRRSRRRHASACSSVRSSSRRGRTCTGASRASARPP